MTQSELRALHPGVRARLLSLFRPPFDVETDVAAANGWIVVPVESASHFDSNDLANISKAFSSLGATALAYCTTEDGDSFEEATIVPASPEGVSAFEAACGHFNAVLFDQSFAAAVFCTTEDFFLVVGPEAFCELACGHPVAQARAKFVEYAETAAPWLRDRLRKVAQRYARER